MHTPGVELTKCYAGSLLPFHGRRCLPLVLVLEAVSGKEMKDNKV